MLLHHKWINSRRVALVLLALVMALVNRGAVISEPLVITLMVLVYGLLIFMAFVLELLRILTAKMEKPDDMVWIKNLYRRFFMPCLVGSAALFIIVTVDRYRSSAEEAIEPILAQRVMCSKVTHRNRPSRIVPEKSGKFCFGIEDSTQSFVSVTTGKIASSLGKEIAHDYSIIRLPKDLSLDVGMGQPVIISAIKKPSVFGSYILATHVTIHRSERL